MSTFIKAGFWEKLCKPCKGYKGWLNLDEFVTNIVTALIPPVPTPTYKIYSALLSQDVDNNPSLISELENTLGDIVSITGSLQEINIQFLNPVIIDATKLIGFSYSAGPFEDKYFGWSVNRVDDHIIRLYQGGLSEPQPQIRVDIKVYN